MELSYIVDNIETDFDTLKSRIENIKDQKLKEQAAQYEIESHGVLDTSKRPMKVVDTDNGPESKEVHRIPIPFQKKIVQNATAFLCANPVRRISKPKAGAQTQLVEVIDLVWEKNKLDYETFTLAEHLMSETEVAEIWFTEDVEPDYWAGTANAGKTKALRMKIIAPSLGDTLHPLYNNKGNMIGFGRGYSLKGEDNEDIEHFDIYTDDFFYFKSKGKDGVWQTDDAVQNTSKKIPVIYYSQGYVEWPDVQRIIERLEEIISNHADINDYNGSPILLLTGDVEGWAGKGERGKAVKLKDGANAAYLTWDSAPESIKLEYNTLRALLFEMTNTTDLSFEAVSGFGQFSGIAIKMLFMPSHLKAARKEIIVGKGIQRRINFVTHSMIHLIPSLAAAKNLSIKPKFEYFLPEDDKEMIDILVQATAGKVMSYQTAVRLNSKIEDKVAEIEQLKKEADEAAKLAEQQELNNDLNDQP